MGSGAGGAGGGAGGAGAAAAPSPVAAGTSKQTCLPFCSASSAWSAQSGVPLPPAVIPPC